MCKDCQGTNQKLDDMQNNMRDIRSYIASLSGQLSIASDEQYEYSECMCAGGPSGKYSLKNPFDKTAGVMYRIDSITGTGAGGYDILISPDRNSQLPGFVATDTPTSELTPITGMVVTGNTAASVPLTSSWYPLTNSSGVIYITVATTTSAYVNVQFKVKRY